MALFGRTPYHAVHNFRSTLQRAISCVTPSVITVRGSDYAPASEHLLTIGGGGPVKLPGANVALSIQHFVRVRESESPHIAWQTETFAYFYALEEQAGPEIIAYHWHPGERSSVKSPHLHLEAGANVGRAELQKAHIPTGLVELEDVLWLAIREFGARPRRDDWAMILGRE